jgi:hypothetical protein
MVRMGPVLRVVPREWSGRTLWWPYVRAASGGNQMPAASPRGVIRHDRGTRLVSLVGYGFWRETCRVSVS